jgi:hypothetical protein
MPLAHAYVTASGTHRNDCRWLVHRYDDTRGFDPERCDSWVGLSTHDRLTSVMVQRGWLTDLHETPGRTWVSTSAGRVYEYAEAGLGGQRTEHVLAGVLRGVWGPADEHVMAWGLSRGRGVVHRYDGHRWAAIDHDTGIVRVHGTADGTCVRALADGGHVLRVADDHLDHESSLDAPLTDLFVAADRTWAVSSDGQLFGSDPDWHAVARVDQPLHCVAVWRDRVWAGGPGGLYELRDRQLHLVRDTFAPRAFDTRGDLLVISPTHLVSSDDGEAFKGRGIKGVAELARGKPVPWR